MSEKEGALLMRAALASGDMRWGERLRPRKKSPILFLKELLPSAL